MCKPKVLFVDDEVSILNALRRLLRNEAIEVMSTHNPQEALQMVKNYEFAVIISDQRMPEMDGSKLLEKVKDISPDSIRVLLTGYADIHAAVEAINKGFIYKFISKPWEDTVLVSMIQEAVSRYALVMENKHLNELISQQNDELKVFNLNLEQKVQERTEEVNHLSDELKKSLLGTIQVMAKMAESHSSVIGSHSKRVALLCQAIGERLGLSTTECHHLIIAATLHDIGKVCIEPEILNKPHKLLKNIEKERLMQHTLYGESMLRMVPNMEAVAQIIRHHHELYNGAGYPERLKGSKIPLGSRIISVVDVYDSFLNTRSSYESLTPNKAFSFIQSKSGIDFDPDIVEALGRYVRDGGVQDDLEIEINSHDLKEGMVLSRDLITVRGLLLLPKESLILKAQLYQIVNFLQSDPPMDGIYVYRHKASSPKDVA